MTNKQNLEPNGPLGKIWDAEDGAIVRIGKRRFRVRLHENEVMLRSLDGESFWICLWDQETDIIASVLQQIFI